MIYPYGVIEKEVEADKKAGIVKAATELSNFIQSNTMIKHLLLFTLSLLLLFTSQSQTGLQNSGILFIAESSDTLYISGAFTNAKTSSLTNNGNLYVRQAFTNSQPDMPLGNGTLFLNGNTLQIIGGTKPFRTFNLVTDNKAGIALNTNLHVSGVHHFANGIITTSVTPNYLVYEEGSSYSGSSDTRHVNGWVKKLGNTDFIFPVGNGIYLRSVELRNLSETSEFDARYKTNTPNANYVASPIALVDKYEYWNIQKLSGANAEVTLNWDNSNVSFPEFSLTEIRVVNYSGGLWMNRGGSATGRTTSTGVVTSNTLSGFGLFSFGSIASSLPLQFLGFTAQRKQNYSQLDWTTSNEFNVDHFEIERSDDGIRFRRIGLTAANNTNGTNNYQYKDNLPLNGYAWYRIKSVDRDGLYKYSRVAIVSDRRSNNTGIYIINNPVYQNIYLSTGVDYAGKFDYSIVNTIGQLMQKGNITTSAGGVTIIPLNAAMASGVYVLDLRNNVHEFTQKIVVR